MIASETRLDLLDAVDVGRFSGGAFGDPGRFSGQVIDLAAELLTASEIAAKSARVTGEPVTAVNVSPYGAVRRCIMPSQVVSEGWCNVEGYKSRFGQVEGARHIFDHVRSSPNVMRTTS